MRRFTAVLLSLTLVQAAVGIARAGERGSASVIDFGRSDAPGVQATAVRIGIPARLAREGGGAASASSHDPSAVAVGVAAPVAISAHNCIPRTDPRGVSLSFEFFESSIGDCISFVSPAPLEATDRPGARRPRPPSPAALAGAAFDRVISLAPRPELRAAPARIGLTGLPSFFWVGNELRTVTATAGVPGLTVTAEARPVRFRWEFGDGSERDTAHQGQAWTNRRPGNVAHLYETRGRYEPAVTVVWAARWRVNLGPWRDLGYFTTDGSIDYPVREMIAVLVRRR